MDTSPRPTGMYGETPPWPSPERILEPCRLEKKYKPSAGMVDGWIYSRMGIMCNQSVLCLEGRWKSSANAPHTILLNQ